MANQTDVQQLVQGLSSGSNNGNPNTTYNNAPGIPMADANGNWYLQNLPTAASINLSRSSGGAGGGGFGFPGVSLPPLTSKPFIPTIPTGPAIGGGGTLPPGDGTGTPVGGGGTAPPNLSLPSGGTGNLFSTGGSGWQSNNAAGGINDPSITSGFINTLPSGFMGSIDGFRSSVDNNTSGAGYRSDLGGTDQSKFLQFLDMVSEPLIKGDLFQSGTGKVSLTNLLASLGTRATGLPINRITDMLTKWQANQGDGMGDTFLERVLLDRAIAKQENKAALSERKFDKSMFDKEVAALAASAPAAPAVDLAALYKQLGVQGMSAKGYNPAQIQAASQQASGGMGVGLAASGAFTPAGASVIQGDAARAMFEGMARQKAVHQTGADSFGRVFAK